MLALRTLFGRSAARSSIIRASSSLNVLSRRKVGLESSDPVVPGAPRERVVPVVVPKHASEPPVDVDAKAEAPGPSMTPAEFRKLHQITVKGDDSAAFEPWINFEDTPFAPSLKRVFSTAGYTSPTSIQACAWPIALGKRDVISVARTGSGKTCGFLLPALHRIMEEREADKFVAQKRYGATRGARKIPSVLVLAPTRELAVQIEAEAQKYSRAANAFIMSMYGGASKGMQIQKLRAGVDIVVATPGRCNDLLEMGVLNLSAVKYLVLDEADRMLDMGFEPQIRTIIDELPAERQSLFFTATWPKEVQGLASDFLTNPVHIAVGDSNNLNANKAIKQVVTVCSERDKDDELDRVLDQINPSQDPAQVPKTIIFMNRKHKCDDLADSLRHRGYAVDTLHGDKSQNLRTIAMQRFRTGRLRLLVATDVAARGLDVKDISAVINYDFPMGGNGVEDYVHRIGRTARGENTGEAFTFFTRADSERARELAGVLQRSEQEIPPALASMMQRGGSSGGGRGGYGGGRGGGGGGGGFPRRSEGRFGGSSGGGSRYGSPSRDSAPSGREWAPKKSYSTPDSRQDGSPRYGSMPERSASTPAPDREWGAPSGARTPRFGLGERRSASPPSSRSAFNFGDRINRVPRSREGGEDQ